MNAPTAARSLLRRGIPRLAPRTLTARLQTRPVSSQDDLGGPGGQMPPPPKPGGPEAIKRNGLLYAGIGLFALAAYAYLSQPRETERAAGKAMAAGERAKEAGKQELRNTKEEVVGGVQKMSGRDTDGQKGFRSE
ncbi:hypothetical protein ISF_01811 [Cordyceps fumosorosea ARSEF 2679]|uniref:Uncharacterized protein n=1 Tax=Cordyceps fumosorosea (strain ARSEF 2679) TaxID=1081104 RepID=A0A168CDQ1_CORFA|nr:hypothetical protein ISF_01811 [Cordyceps fumosorosea ARSEF 2679]OAA71260.1 hypothetical protein ISF_01811 [Cordyceps fumosorosea ARSEF 2679]